VVISAPTAFGKTYIFMIPILLFAISNAMSSSRDSKKKGTIAVIFYPRKSLGSDQMGRFIRLIHHINTKLGVKITIGIDDGDTKYEKDLKEGEEYRGIKCPIHPNEKLIIRKETGKAYVYCNKCGRPLDFIVVSREDFKSTPPHILITNVWAYQYRLCDPEYWENGYLSSNIRFYIFDEIHAYRSIVAGILRYFIRTLKTLVSPNARIVFSSATIPKLEEFIKDISGLDISNFVKLVYNEETHGKDGEKLELYMLVGIHPLAPWETYIHELAIFLSTISRISQKRSVQSLIFVDSIRSISRLYTETLESIKTRRTRRNTL